MRKLLKVLNVELKYTALKQLLATALAISLGGLLLEYVPLGFNDLMEGISEPSVWDMAFMRWQIPCFCCFYILQITKERWRPPDVFAGGTVLFNSNIPVFSKSILWFRGFSQAAQCFF